MEALKKSLAEKRKPAQAATASAASEQEELPLEAAAPKKRSRKTRAAS
jgi:hypothetical protein